MRNRLFKIIYTLCFILLLSGCSSSIDYITLPNYEGVDIVTGTKYLVTESDVTDKIVANLQAHLVLQTVTNRPVEADDIVNMDIVGTVNGKSYTNSELYGYELKIGSDSLVKGFDDEIIGHSIGDTFSFNLIFPEAYYNNLVAGKPVLYYVKINGIRSQTTPDLNDDFVRQVSTKSTTLAEYRVEIKEELEAKNNSNNKQVLSDLAWQYLMDYTIITEYPQDALDEELAAIEKNYQDIADEADILLERYIGQTLGINTETFHEQNLQQAKDKIKADAIILTIAETQKINPSYDEYVSYYESMADTYGYHTVEELLHIVSEDELQNNILTAIVKNHVADSVNQVYN